MRLIDGDALIKALIRKEPFSDCARVVIAECVEEVRHAPTIEPEPYWIPCSERLPEEYGNYLVSIEGEEETDIGSIDPKVRRWSLCDATGFYWADNLHVKITAWRELPEPYKGEI